jgi:RNA polymerase sigma factor (sigma-70 family)
VTRAGHGTLAETGVNEEDRYARMGGLVHAARDGSPEALGELVTELTPMLWHAARATGLSEPDAEDVVQTVWLSLVSHLDTIRTPAALTAWLLTTTRREAWRVRAIDHKLRPVGDEWLTAIPDPGASAEERVIVNDEMRHLWRAFHDLSPRCQQLLRIVAFIPRPDYDAVAASLGMARGSVGPTRGRCLGKLRAALRNVGAP